MTKMVVRHIGRSTMQFEEGEMARRVRKVKGEDWSGHRVSYQPAPDQPEEFGTVTRMASGKETCMFVLFEGSETAKLCYARSLKKVGEF